MIIKNLDSLVYAVSYDNIDKFHMFMRDFKTNQDTFDKYAGFLTERIMLDQAFLSSFDFFIFVPSLDASRTNYSQKLAEFISSKTNKPLKRDVLQKIRQTKELKTLPREERHGEIKNSFSSRLKGGEKICIVDDVTASGATLEEISTTLKKTGASFISAVVVAVYTHQSRHNF